MVVSLPCSMERRHVYLSPSTMSRTMGRSSSSVSGWWIWEPLLLPRQGEWLDVATAQEEGVTYLGTLTVNAWLWVQVTLCLVMGVWLPEGDVGHGAAFEPSKPSAQSLTTVLSDSRSALGHKSQLVDMAPSCLG